MKIFPFLIFVAFVLTTTVSFADTTCVNFPGLSEYNYESI